VIKLEKNNELILTFFNWLKNGLFTPNFTCFLLCSCISNKKAKINHIKKIPNSLLKYSALEFGILYVEISKT